VLDAIGEGQAAPATLIGVGDVGGDLLVARLVGGEFAVDGLDGSAAGAGLVGGEVAAVHDKVFAKLLRSSISWRIGPHCMVIRAPIWSARYGSTGDLCLSLRRSAAPGSPSGVSLAGR
jgi:hypothetical protein